MFFAPSSALSDALCLRLDEKEKRAFFARGGGAKAKAICAECPVRQACLDRALSFEQPGEKRFGIWGGMTPREREQKFGGVTGEMQAS